eukprot:gene7496-11819_t
MNELEERLKKLKEKSTITSNHLNEDDLIVRYEKLKGNKTETKKKTGDEVEDLLSEVLDEISLEKDVNLLNTEENQETDLDFNSIFKDIKKHQNVSENEVDNLISQVYDDLDLDSRDY